MVCRCEGEDDFWRLGRGREVGALVRSYLIFRISPIYLGRLDLNVSVLARGGCPKALEYCTVSLPIALE